MFLLIYLDSLCLYLCLSPSPPPPLCLSVCLCLSLSLSLSLSISLSLCVMDTTWTSVRLFRDLSPSNYPIGYINSEWLGTTKKISNIGLWVKHNLLALSHLLTLENLSFIELAQSGDSHFRHTFINPLICNLILWKTNKLPHIQPQSLI